MSFQIAGPAVYRRPAVSMSGGVNLLQSLIERRPKKAEPNPPEAGGHGGGTSYPRNGKLYPLSPAGAKCDACQGAIQRPICVSFSPDRRENPKT